MCDWDNERGLEALARCGVEKMRYHYRWVAAHILFIIPLSSWRPVRGGIAANLRETLMLEVCAYAALSASREELVLG